MKIVTYAYISKPIASQIHSLLTSINDKSISITHLGKNDPPSKFIGEINDAVNFVFEGNSLTNYTFFRDKAKNLEFDIQIHNDSAWSHSTISITCLDEMVLKSIQDSIYESFDTHLCVNGNLDFGKNQNWEILYVSDECPNDLRQKFILE